MFGNHQQFWLEGGLRRLGDGRNEAGSSTTPQFSRAEAIAQYRCVKCSFRPDSLEALRRHITVDHLKWIPYECLYCDLFKATDEELTEHIRESHPFKPVKLVVEKNEPMRLQLEHLIQQSTFGHQQPVYHQTASITVNLANESAGSWAESSKAEVRSVGALGSPSPFVLSNTPAPWALLPKAEIVDLIAESDSPQANAQTPFQWCSGSPTSKEDSAAQSGQPLEASAPTVNHTVSAAKPVPQPPPSAPRMPPRKPHTSIHHLKLTTTICNACGTDVRKSSVGPTQHVHEHHLFEPAILCKYCGKGVQYNIGAIREHIRHHHRDGSVETGVEDRRHQLRPLVEMLLVRCFRTSNYPDSAPADASSVPEMPAGKQSMTEKHSPLVEPDSVGSVPVAADQVASIESDGISKRHGPVSESASVGRVAVATDQVADEPMETENNDDAPNRGAGAVAELTEGQEPAETLPTDVKQELHDQDAIPCFDATAGPRSSVKAEPADNQHEAVIVLDDDDDESPQNAATTSSSSIKSSKRERKVCQLCKCVVWFGRRHTQLRHLLGATLFACSVCPFRSNASPAAVSRHVQSTGCGGELVDKRAENLVELNRLHDACFGDRQRSAAADTICID